MRQPISPFWRRLWLAFIFGLGLSLSTTLTGVALAQREGDSLPPEIARRPEPPEVSPKLPSTVEIRTPSLVYAQVITDNVPVYQDPDHASQGITPTRWLAGGYVWVSLPTADSISQGEQQWYHINENEYVQADYLNIFQPSQFKGLELGSSNSFAWMVFDAWTASEPGELPGDGSVLLTRYTLVPVHEEQVIEEKTWYQVGYNQWVEQEMVGLISPKPRPEGIGPADKWIEIDLFEQTLAAYEGDRMVYATLVSSGLPWWQTTTGLFKIWIKVRQAKMSGRDGYPDYYFLEDVPWTMYFNDNFALHGAYWHDRFGIKHSHGCVNLAPADAQWLFEWTTPTGTTGWVRATEENPGTWVWVHE
jgi:hypothetical protein